ncbi:MAG: RNA polymerase sigma factor [Planctomycetota bacterium]
MALSVVQAVFSNDPPTAQSAATTGRGDPLSASQPRPASGSTDAFVQDHLTAIWRYLRMHGASAADADDLAQDAFVTALRRGVERLEPVAARVFLQRTARFKFLHHVRDRKNAPALADEVDELWSTECEQDGGAEIVERVRSCVGQLEGRARTAIQQCYGIDNNTRRPAAEVAVALNLKPNGLKTLLQRARHLLRTCLARRGA